METKHLMLLILIPLIAVSIIFYTNQGSQITGAVTAEQQSKILGTYSVNPSFKQKFEHDFTSEYQQIQENLDNIIGKCKEEPNIKQCFEAGSFEYGLNCHEPAMDSNDEYSNLLKDFTNKFGECLNLEEKGIVCAFSLDDRKIGTNTFTIRLIPEGNQITAKLTSLGSTEPLATSYLAQGSLKYMTNFDTKESDTADEIYIVVIYRGGKPFIISEVSALKGDSKINLMPYLPELKQAGVLYFYKTEEVNFIEAGVENSFRDKNSNKIVDLSISNGFVFCAKSNNKIYAYDSSDGEVKLRDIVYQLAVTYPTQKPK